MDLSKQHFDVIVVGTGPGGATIAKELTEKGWKVLILEWGTYEPITGTTLNGIPQIAIPGKSLLFTPELYGIGRGITTGGSTIFYYAAAIDPPVAMLRSYGIDITKEIEETREELPIAPLPDEWISPMSMRIMENARALGLNWGKLDKFIYAGKLSEVSNGGWGWIAAPTYESKWNARMFIDCSLSSGATIVNRARVTKVIVEDRRAIGVEFTRFGTSHRAYGRTIVISAGGIGSPVILRASGIKEAGYRYFFDPLVTVMGTIKDFRISPLIPMSTGLLCEEEGYMMTDMFYPPLLFFLNHVAGFRLHRLFAQPRTMQIMVKIKDSLGGRLTNRGDVIKVLKAKDRSKLLHGYDRARRILTRAGAKGIFKGWVIAGHPGGTVKINHLLDANLKAEYDNLYVCDCSVIPEAWGLPPTFTLVCLAKRLAKHLVGTAGPK